MDKKPLKASDLEAPLTEETAANAELEALSTENNELSAKLEEKEALLMRTLAARDNAEKRMTKQIADAHSYALLDFCKDLLPLMDSLQKACESSADADDATKEGITLTQTLFAQTLSKHEVEAIDPLDQPFDPSWHEAIATEKAEDKEEQVVLNVMQIGYRLKDRLLRPALVVVNRT